MTLNKSTVDGGSIVLIVGSMIEWLPHIAAGLAIVWWCFRIYGQWLENKKLRKDLDNAKRL